MAVPAFLNMIGPTELILLLVLVLIVFGAGKLPAVLSQLGSGMKAFRDAQKDDALDVTRTSAPKPHSLGSDDLRDPLSEAEELKAKEKAS
jgi:sec-independent protein translocase protein TatA